MLERSAFVPLSLLATLAVAAVFFAPAAPGPFSVTHGPATAFRAARYASNVFRALRLAVEVAAAFLFGVRLGSGVQFLRALPVAAGDPASAALFRFPILRC